MLKLGAHVSKELLQTIAVEYIYENLSIKLTKRQGNNPINFSAISFLILKKSPQIWKNKLRVSPKNNQPHCKYCSYLGTSSPWFTPDIHESQLKGSSLHYSIKKTVRDVKVTLQTWFSKKHNTTHNQTVLLKQSSCDSWYN